jgi:hypothetical protein
MGDYRQTAERLRRVLESLQSDRPYDASSFAAAVASV